MGFSVVIPVGPKPRELDRLRDVIDSLIHFEGPNIRRVVIIDDVLKPRRQIKEITANAPFSVDQIINPRLGRGSGWSSGLTVGILSAYAHLAQQDDIGDFVLKLDTDAILIRPCSAAISTHLLSGSRIGMVGAYKNLADRPNERQAARVFEKLLRPIAIWRPWDNRLPRVTGLLVPGARRVRNLIIEALMAGYVLGEFCFGGSYAVRTDCLRDLYHSGHFNNPKIWLATPCGEDIALSLLVRLRKWEMADAVAPGEPFGVCWLKLGFAPEEMVARGYSIVHPVIDHPDRSEAQIRAVFRACRT